MKKLIVLAAALALGGCAPFAAIKEHFHKAEHPAPVVHAAPDHVAAAPTAAVRPSIIKAAPAQAPVAVPAVPAPAPKKARLFDRIKDKLHHKKEN